MQRGEVPHHAFVLVLLIGVDGLSVLAKVVETGELFGAVAGKRAFTGVFPNVPGKMFASAEHHSTVSVASALEGLCRCGSVSFADARRGQWGCDEGSGHVGGVVGLVWLLFLDWARF